jgi:hypothetical protein
MEIQPHLSRDENRICGNGCFGLEETTKRVQVYVGIPGCYVPYKLNGCRMACNP